MKQSFRLFLSIIVIGLISQISQVQAQTDNPQFHFPLEVGNVWAYQEYDHPQCISNGECSRSRLRVVDRLEADSYVCGIIEVKTSRTLYHESQIAGSIVEGISEYVLCQVDNRIYIYSELEDVTGDFQDRDMIADFDRDEDQPWLLEYDGTMSESNPYKLRRLFDRDLEHEVGPYGRIEYSFTNYLAVNPQDIDGITGGEFVSGVQDYFTSGLGFPVLGWGFYFTSSLRGYYLNGQVTGDTTTVYTTSIDDVLQPERSERPALLSTYPNPFNPKTHIRWTMDVGRETRIAVYDVMGREIQILVDGMMPSGQHSVTFDAAGLPSGMYVIILETNNGRAVRKVTLVK